MENNNTTNASRYVLSVYISDGDGIRTHIYPSRESAELALQGYKKEYGGDNISYEITEVSGFDEDHVPPIHPDDRCQFLAEIVECFEDFLDEKGIELDNEDKHDALARDGYEPEEISTLFGEDYYHLEEGVENILIRYNVLSAQ